MSNLFLTVLTVVASTTWFGSRFQALTTRRLLKKYRLTSNVLVRPHLEYAVPVWASICDKDLRNLEDLQPRCIKRVLGTKADSSSSAVEVISGVIPFGILKRELCCSEYIRIINEGHNHPLMQLFNQSWSQILSWNTFESRVDSYKDSCFTDVSRTIIFPDRRFPDKHVLANILRSLFVARTPPVEARSPDCRSNVE